ncbi:MAG: ABC transporter ATP-binding protein [Clostridia bacterium]|nr:MAG: ABC transporter ATP-binding protein [Clostridia bacterium]
MVTALNHREGITILAAAALHDLNLALEFFSKFILLYQGKSVAPGPAEEVITSENLQRVYGVPAQVYEHPITRRRQVLVLPAVLDSSPGSRDRLHLVCGGGTGASLTSGCCVRAIASVPGSSTRGIAITKYARLCGPEIVEVPPFCPVSSQAASRALDVMQEASDIPYYLLRDILVSSSI